MFKKLVSVVILALLLLSVVSNSLAESMAPFAVVQCNVLATIIITDGKAQAAGTVAHVPSGYSVKTSVVLQKKSGNSWVKVSSSSGVREACASATAVKGVTYRAYATSKLYDKNGAFVDSIAATSGSKTN
ncbi:MAG: hypothetical protein RR547_08015 [Raoultibacter sp.]